MKITCTNLRKTDIIKVADVGSSKSSTAVLTFMNTPLHSKEIHFFPATLTNEYAQFMVILNGEFKKKKYLNFKSQSWLTGVSDDTEDDKAVNHLNDEVLSLLNQLKTKSINHSNALTVPARVHGTTVMSPLTFGDDAVVSPGSVYYLNTSDIDVIFCERVTSYTKSFDLTFVLKNKKVHTHSCIDRKRINELRNRYQHIEFYETGPDPLPWKQMFNYHKDSTWKEIHELITAVPSDDEDDDEEWVDDESEEDDDFDEYVDDEEEEEDYPEDDDYETESDEEDDDYAPSHKKRKY